MNFGSISSLYILSKTSEKSWNENLSFDLKSFSQEGTGLTGAHHRSDRWYPWSHTIFFWDLSGCKVSYKTPEEVFRGVYSKLEWRIRTSKARSVLPIWFLCWIYQNHRYYRARVGKTAKGSLARPRAVTGLTGGARLQPWANSEKNLLFYPASFSLLHYSPASTHPNRGDHLLSLLPPLSKPIEIWRFN
jgi:hypothetical protein